MHNQFASRFLRLDAIHLVQLNLGFYYNSILKLAFANKREELPVPYTKMADSKSDSQKLVELGALFNRLQQAKIQAQQLISELSDIQQQITLFENCSLFKGFQKSQDKSDYTKNSEESDDPPPKKAKYDFMEENGYTIVYTDGACENNGKSNAKAGLGVWFGENHPLNVSKPVTGKATNNVGEIQACVAAVQIAKRHGINKLKIITDSQFIISAMTSWIKNWKKNNWKLAGGRGDVKNKTDFMELDRLCGKLDVKWQHVSGHTGVIGNEAADKLAREGARHYKT